MNTITCCVNKALRDGYVDSFEVKDGSMFSTREERYFTPAEVNVINFYRFEGQSNPADSAIMYVIETAGGQKGTLIDAYGPCADESTNRFMSEVEAMHRRSVAARHQ